MPAEWHIRHWELAMSAPVSAGNRVTLVGNCKLTLPQRASDCLVGLSCELAGLSARSRGAPATSSPASATGVAQIAADLRSLKFMNTPSDSHDACKEIDSITLRMKPPAFQLG